jgi:hypothetical protein
MMTRVYMFTRDETNPAARERHILRCDEDSATGSGSYAITRDPIPDNYDGYGTSITRPEVSRMPAESWEPITLDEMTARNISTTRSVPSYWDCVAG